LRQKKDSSKKLNLQLGLFGRATFLFASTQILGIIVGISLLSQQVIVVEETSSSIFGFLTAFIMATLFLILLLKFFKTSSMFKLLMIFLIFIGAEAVFSTFLFEELAILLAVEVVLLRFLWPNVFTQNLSMILALAGIGSVLGLMLSIPAILTILVVLSIYDFVAVYKTKHMLTLFKGLLGRGVPFSLIIPTKSGHLDTPVKKATSGTGEFMLLGTGDVAFPLIFAVSALRVSLLSSLAVFLGGLCGLFIVHLLLVKTRRPLPALPPMALCTIVAYFVSILILGVG